MQSSYKIGLAAMVFILTILVPAAAHASIYAPASATKTTGAHARSLTYHDRTPRVHTHGSHPHHG